jgi:putative transposase
MARIARAVAVGIPHHVTQRGNGRQRVFFTDRDRDIYLDMLFDYASRYSLRVWGYCLMTNHVHFIVAPETEHGLARAFGRAHADYARYANIVQRSCGHFWQARFFSCALEPAHVWKALAYIERNPVRAGLVDAAEEYEWSSAAAHCAEDDLEGRLDVAAWLNRYSGAGWREALRVGVEEQAWAERVREATRRGLPLGSDQFVEQMGKHACRDLKARPPGRPRKEPVQGALHLNG